MYTFGGPISIRDYRSALVQIIHMWAELMACAVFDHMTYCGKAFFFVIVLRCGKRAQSFGHINPSIN